MLYTAFLKNYDSGELLNQPNFDVFRYNPTEGFWRDFSDEKRREAAETMNRQLSAVIEKSGDYDLIILDEILNAVEVGAVKENILLEAINNKCVTTELVLTGRSASERICGAADYITEMKAVKHPFNHGEAARIGIEY